MKALIYQPSLEEKILVIRGHKVMIDRDLSELFGVETKYLNRQVRRNINRFPKEFMLVLTKKEKDELVTICHQFDNLKHSRYLPLAFTEHGVTMLASILNSEKAIKISICIVKTFMKLRHIVATHKNLEEKISNIEKNLSRHDKELSLIFDAIRKLMAPASKNKKQIGFVKD